MADDKAPKKEKELLKPGEVGKKSELDKKDAEKAGLERHHIPQAAWGFTTNADGLSIALPKALHRIQPSTNRPVVAIKPEKQKEELPKKVKQEIKDLEDSIADVEKAVKAKYPKKTPAEIKAIVDEIKKELTQEVIADIKKGIEELKKLHGIKD